MRTIYFKNKPFMACVFEEGNAPIECVPVVCSCSDGLNFGAGILLPNNKTWMWGLYMPRNLIAAWRATEVLHCLDVIERETLVAVNYTGKRNVRGDDFERYVRPIISKIGKQTYSAIMAMPVPEEIIRAILDNQKGDLKPDLWPIVDEVLAGTIIWRQEFANAGLEHPDETDAKKRAKKEKIAKFEYLLISYAKFRNRPRDSVVMDDVEKIILELIGKGADRTYSDCAIVALAGAAGDFIGSELADGNCFDCHRTREAISKSAQWLVFEWTNSHFAFLFWKSTGKLCLLSLIENFLRQTLNECFSQKPADVKVPV
mgnify:FL=1